MKDKGRNALIASDDVHNVGVRPRNGDKVYICNFFVIIFISIVLLLIPRNIFFEIFFF
jgi:hypothetical protein